MKTINLDITTVTSGIIVHQVNCRGVMGSGVAKAIRDKYPQHFIDYYNFLRRCTKSGSDPLGDVVWTQATTNLQIAGVFGQRNFGIRKELVYTDYEALALGLKLVHFVSKDKQVYLPYNIACGRANGDWNIVLPIIQEELPNAILCKVG